MITLLSTRFGDIKVDRETLFGDLPEAFNIINAARLSEGRPVTTHYNWRKSQHARSYLRFLEQQLGFVPIVLGRRGGGKHSTQAHALVMLKAACDLSDVLSFEVYSTFLSERNA